METDRLKVFFLAAEADPFVKIGGLGDVAGSLPHALIKEGLDVRLALPLHASIQQQNLSLQQIARYNVNHQDGRIEAVAFKGYFDGLTVYFISGDPIPTQAPVYSGNNAVDGYKYTFFSLAALQLLENIDWSPNILHANDWHTAPAVYALDLSRRNSDKSTNIASVLGIHNLPFLGHGAESALLSFGLPPASASALPKWAQSLPLPLGMLSCDQIITVSPSYAQEILTPEFGSGLDSFLRTRQSSLNGVLNGLAVDQWNPASDKALPIRYDVNTIDNRRNNKRVVLEELSLAQGLDIPLFAVISRLDPQKGVDLLPAALHAIKQHPWQLVILGNGVPDLEHEMRLLESIFPGRVKAEIRYDFNLSRKIYGGADMLLIPSRYEPCGLTQMIGMLYGCIPVARAVGGLKDTIRGESVRKTQTGFLFEHESAEDLAAVLRQSLRVFERKKGWRSIQENGMVQDFSWERSAKQYIRIYNQIIRV
jgi:starch synthase